MHASLLWLESTTNQSHQTPWLENFIKGKMQVVYGTVIETIALTYIIVLHFFRLIAVFPD